MPFEPWLKQPEQEEERHYHQDDPSLLSNHVKLESGEKPRDWFLDHLDVKLAEKVQ